MRKSWSVTHEMHADVLNRWQEGESLGIIAKAVGISRNRVSIIVNTARRRGDPRAEHHRYPNGMIIGRCAYRPQPAMQARKKGHEPSIQQHASMD